MVNKKGSQKAKDVRKTVRTAGWKIFALEQEIWGRRIEAATA